MTDRPDGAAILWQARETFLDALLPHLPESERLNALMIANAISIGARELAGAETAEPPDEAGLAAAIRGGVHDGDAELHAQLTESCEERLRLANPKALR